MDFNELKEICEGIFDSGNNPFKTTASPKPTANTQPSTSQPNTPQPAQNKQNPSTNPLEQNGIMQGEMDELAKNDGSDSEIDKGLADKLKKLYPNPEQRRRILDSMMNALSK